MTITAAAVQKRHPADPVTPLVVPFVILRDIQEKNPWFFTGLRADAPDNYRPLLVRTVSRYLGEGCGDYTIEGHEGQLSIERKGLADCFGTILAGRNRFVRELENLNATRDYAAVVVEADWSEISTCSLQHWEADGIPERARAMRRKTVIRSILAWQLRYPTVRWWLLPGRRAAEAWAFRLMERWWKEKMRAAAKTIVDVNTKGVVS